MADPTTETPETSKLFTDRPAPIPPTNGPQQPQISRPAQPDSFWARMQPVTIVPHPDRLNAKHQRVALKNTSDTELSFDGMVRPQLHIVIDRHMVGHEIQPGQTLPDIDMVALEIEGFLRQRKRGRFSPSGREYPLHPIMIIGFDPDKVLPGEPPEVIDGGVSNNKKSKAA